MFIRPTASAMQTLLDVCYEYSIDKDILFNPIKSVCTVFKPKAYKLYLPTVCISSDTLKFIKESKYLGFTFSDSKSDDCDMLRQMRLLYVQSNKLLRTFSHCSTNVKITLFQSYCTALYCSYLWNDYKKSTFSKVRVAFNNAYRKIFGLPKRSSASTMYANNNICNFLNNFEKKHIWVHTEAGTDHQCSSFNYSIKVIVLTTFNITSRTVECSTKTPTQYNHMFNGNVSQSII